MTASVGHARHWIKGVAGQRGKGRPPGPNLVQFSRVVAGHLRNPYPLLPTLASRYGDVVDIPTPLPNSTMTLLSHPDHVDHIMTRNPQRYLRFGMTRDLVLGEIDVMPVMEGEEWRRWRKPLNPFFGEQTLANLSPQMSAAVTEGVEAWSRFDGAIDWIDLERELGTVVMDALMRSMFSAEIGPDTLSRYVDAARDLGRYTIVRAMMLSLPGFVPRPRARKGEAALSMILGELDTLIARRMASGPCDPPDVLDALIGMSASFGGGPEMQYRRLRTEVSGLIFAGFETTAASVAWAIGLLQAEPAALARAYAEVDELGQVPIEYAHLNRLPYLRAVIEETLRIQAMPVIMRTAVEADEIDGYQIPNGSHIMISPYGLHRDERFWNHPERFEPNRFLTDKINRNAFIPFNIGPRKCMGWRMAYIDGLMTLATILQRYTFVVEPSWTPRPTMRISTGLVGGLPVRLTARES